MTVALCLSCVPQQTKEPPQTVAQVRGQLNILSFDNLEVVLQDLPVFLIPDTPQARAFVAAHQDDYHIAESLLQGLPGITQAKLDRDNAFSFAAVREGSYFVYWQLPAEKSMDVHNRSIPNQFIPVFISPEHNDLRLANAGN